MVLNNLEELWGVPVVKLKDYSRRYRLYSSLIFLVDAVAMSILVYFMYKYGTSFYVYTIVIVLLCLLCSLWLNVMLNPARMACYKFYRRNRNRPVRKVTFELTAENLYNILYCIGFKRLKLGKSVSAYKELFLSACSEDYYYSGKLTKYMMRYEVKDIEESKDCYITAYIMEKGKKLYFIDFISDEKENKDVECNNE